jgi:hypothetical protein
MKRTLGLVLMCCLIAAYNGNSGATGRDAEVPDAGGDGKGTVVELGGLKSKTPADWKKEEPKGSLRTAQFRVPHADNDAIDAELVVFHFGKGGGGGVDANIKRWKDMFVAPKGKTIDEMTKVDKFKVSDRDVVLVDISGTYLFQSPGKGDAKKEPRPDHRMLAVILDTAEGAYFIRLVGPARTMEQQQKAFVEWVKNFK